MTMKSFLFSVAAIFLFPAFLTPVAAVDTRAIEAVRAKKVLDDADLRTIDAFVAQAVGEILNTDDFSSISNARSIILANSASSQQGQVQFAQQFSESAKKHIADALRKADALTPPGRGFKVITNLLMLVEGLADLGLVDLPLKYVDSDNAVIRYWAVNCLANLKVIEALNSSKESDEARQIVRRLDAIVETSAPETLGLVAAFAGSVTISDGVDLLLKVADRRIASYADWSVQYELLDADILRVLADKMASSNPDKVVAGRRFGQLYSYVFQRYIKGADVLSRPQKEHLASVLVEAEKSCLSKLIGKSSSDIRKAIESSDINVLSREHNNLLGDSAKPGLLPTELNFDYGKDNTGAALTHPLVLADLPKN